MRRDQFALRAIVVAIGAIAWQQALPNPTGPTVVNGTATFAPNGSMLTVTNSSNAIINWQSFSIGASEITKFVQPSTSAVLNRVTSTSQSSILGSLQSTGRVFLINPNGIEFGVGSHVDVAGLVASSLDISSGSSRSRCVAYNQQVNRRSLLTPN